MLWTHVKTKDKVMNSSNQHLSLQRQYEVNMMKYFFVMVNMIKYYAPKVMQLAFGNDAQGDCINGQAIAYMEAHDRAHVI